MNWNNAEYIGYDIVGSVIEKNKEKYANEKIHFMHSNFLKIDLPKSDLLICKDVLQHLSNKDILQFIPQLKKYKYCLITNEVDADTLTSDNLDILPGDTHKIDLSKMPFNIFGYKIFNYKDNLGSVKQVFLINNTGLPGKFKKIYARTFSIIERANSILDKFKLNILK